MKRALITGITGQDGSFLADLLLEKGYEVYGLVRRLSRPNLKNIQGILEDVTLLDGDLTDQSSLFSAVKNVEPDEVYNLAAQSFVGVSFTQPVLTAEVTGVGVIRMLDAVREFAPEAKFLQASSSEMFGKVQETPQTETTRFYPRSPYGVSKVFAYWATVNYRESYNLWVSNAICFNHESERRGREFVTRKISSAVAEIAYSLRDKLVLGDLSAKRDWGYAPEYVDLMHRILQYHEPDDFVGATGEMHSVTDFLDVAFGIIKEDWAEYVELNARFKRPAEVYELRGDASKARHELGWEPKIRFKELVRIMVEADLDRMEAS